MSQLQNSMEVKEQIHVPPLPQDLASNLAALYAGWPSLARELDLDLALNQEPCHAL